MRNNNEAALPVIAVIVVAMLVVVSIGIYYYAASAGYGDGDDDYIPTLELTLSARADGGLYDADIVMDVESPSFLDYFFTPASVSSPDVGFPKGTKQTLKLFVYDRDSQGDILVEYTWKVGDMYDVRGDGMQESTWTIELPMLQDMAKDDTGAFYLWVGVMVNNSTIGSKRVVANAEVA